MRRAWILWILCGAMVLLPRIAAADEPNNSWSGTPPTATVPLLEFESRQATLTPDFIQINGAHSGDAFLEDKLLHLPAGVTPQMGDILICFDLTGSMWGELNNVRVNAINIMNAVRALIPDSRFGVISHMDYDGYHSGCGYAATYGNLAGYGDYPYALNQTLTDQTADVAAAINALPLGDGQDWPEDYSRVLYESYSDPGIGWRPDAKKIVLLWGDAYPHDCAYDACLGGATTTGPDPGRDAIDMNADDLAILSVLNGMSAADVTLLTVYSGSTVDYPIWQCYTGVTGGTAWQINEDGTIPGGVDIAEYIASIISVEIQTIDYMTLQVCTPGYEAWLTSVVPAGYANLVLDEPIDLPFTITLTVPPGTPAGMHCFLVCAVGDGAVYAYQEVCIEVLLIPSPSDKTTWGQIKRIFH
jgi:hypothetical protein